MRHNTRARFFETQCREMCLGITVGQSLFTDLDYADDAVLFNADPEWVSLLHGFDEEASKMGLPTSWSKINLKKYRI